MRPHRLIVPLVLTGVLLAPAGPASAAFSDVPSGYWASTAIAYVAESRDWMREGSTFRPEEHLRRRQLARAVVRAFARGAAPGPTFSDMTSDDPDFEAASAAVRLGWMTAPDGVFRPEGVVTKIELDRALVRALGLKEEIEGLGAIHTADGAGFDTPPGFPVLVLAHQLRLHYNHGTKSEKRELWPNSRVRRADAAYALHKAATTPSWRLSPLERYRDVTLGLPGAKKRTAIGFALRYVGAPYVYAGEWHRPTPDGYCCGAQAQGGFDCSGLLWWTVRKGDATWSNQAIRGYVGWSLPERSSSAMAKAAPARIRYADLRPLDLVFFDGDRSGGGAKGVDHAGLYLGNGWMIHSASGIDGVSIEWIGSGWYRDRFVWGRRPKQ